MLPLFSFDFPVYMSFTFLLSSLSSDPSATSNVSVLQKENTDQEHSVTAGTESGQVVASWVAGHEVEDLVF
jgi:hypothetical protein